MSRKFKIGHDDEEGVEGGNEQDNGIKLEEQQLNLQKSGGCCGGGKNKKAIQTQNEESQE